MNTAVKTGVTQKVAVTTERDNATSIHTENTMQLASIVSTSTVIIMK